MALAQSHGHRAKGKPKGEPIAILRDQTPARSDELRFKDGTLSNTSRPVQIVASGVVAITSGHTDGLFAKSDGSIWAMGDNSLGQLGDGFTNSTSLPEQIFPSPPPTLSSSISSGTNFQFQASYPLGGTSFCWPGRTSRSP